MLARRHLGDYKPIPIPAKNGDECVLLMHFNNDFSDSSKYNWNIKSNATDLEFQSGKFNNGVVAAEVIGKECGYLTLPNKILNEVLIGDWTIEFWVNMDNVPTTESINKYLRFLSFCEHSTLNFGGILIDVFNTDSGFVFLQASVNSWKDDTENGHLVNVTALETVSGFVHCCIMKKDTTMYAFINGKLKDSVGINPDTITPFEYNGNYIYRVDNSSYGRSNAIIDELRIYSNAVYSVSGFTPPSKEFQGNGDESDQGGGSDIPVSGISVSPKTLTLKLNDTASITCTVSPQDATNKNVSWSASPASAIRIVSSDNNKCVIQCISTNYSSATVTAVSNDGSYRSTCNITIQEDVTPSDPEYNFTGSWTLQSDGYTYKSNQISASASTVMRCTFSGVTEIVFRCRSYGENNYDYLTVGKLDTACTRTKYKTSFKGMSHISNFTELTYSCDENSHYVEFCYSKDLSGDSFDDAAYVYIYKINGEIINDGDSGSGSEVTPTWKTITSSNTSVQIPTGYKTLTVWAVGGGGGGGRASTSEAGSGGNGGAVESKTFTSADSIITVTAETIGYGGRNTADTGNDGGPTTVSFESTYPISNLIAAGGSGGNSGSSTSSQTVGAKGGAGGSSTSYNGGDGQIGLYENNKYYACGGGGGSYDNYVDHTPGKGGGNVGGDGNHPGYDGKNYGCGGGGGCLYTVDGTQYYGGNGFSGCVIIYWE